MIRAGLSLVVDELATLKGKPRPQGQGQGQGDATNARQGGDATPRPQRPPRAPATAGAGFDDALPDIFS